MIEKKYQHFDKLNTSQLLLHSRFSGITTTDDTQSLCVLEYSKEHWKNITKIIIKII